MTSLIKQTNQSTTTRLLTLLNVSATSLKKRRREEAEEQANGETRVVSTTPVGGSNAPPTVKKLNARKEVIVIDEGATLSGEDEGPNDKEMDSDVEMEDKAHKESEGGKDPYNAHFGPDSSYLSDSTRISVDNRKWTTSDKDVGKLGRACVLLPEGAASPGHNAVTGLLDKLQATFEDQLLKKSDLQLRKDLLTTIGSYQDLYLTKRDLKSQNAYREVISLHILNHIMKKRRRILKNNEKLSSLQKDADPSDSNALLDQGFVRPSVLVVLPFRSSAYHWITAFIHQLSGYQVENRARFHSEFTLPAGAEDKLLSAPAGTYSEDHVANMSGNIDDYFRIGMKVTRKSVKLFSDFYSSDIIVASPLGLRELIEKERSADYLSSIEILIIDQLDVLAMQNWNHLKLIFEHINKIPKQSHDTDFSRVKPWYLDGHAAYLRQSILLSAYETPEIRSLFNKNLLNVSGKQRIQSAWAAAQVPEGIRQNFVKFECNNAQAEIDKRFEYFTTRLFPVLLKSAVQSVNTVIFIPSYFDYARIHHWLKTQESVTFAVLSEDSDNRDISRARQAFFSGSKAMLLVTERFHFFRRYKIRGIRNLVFYAPPDHPQFYTEFLSYPFLDDGVLAEDVTCKVLYSKYDYMKLERLVGTAEVGRLIAA